MLFLAKKGTKYFFVLGILGARMGQMLENWLDYNSITSSLHKSSFGIAKSYSKSYSTQKI